MSRHSLRDTKSGQYAKSNGDGIAANEFRELVSNVVMSRSQLMRAFLDPRRDIDDECGYPKTEGLTGEHYRLLYEREPVAARVVAVMPEESWQVQPTVFETEEVDQETAFEAAWNELGRSLRGVSWYQDTEGSPIWEHLRRADELSGIGSFGALLLGIGDGLDLREPVQSVNLGGVTKNQTQRKLLFLRSFDESLVDVTIYEKDINSPRFGQPVEYKITFSDPRTHAEGGVGLPLADKHVHWSRVIHLADNLGSSEIFGVPRMRPVFNRLYDLRKLYGGSAEMYWRGAFPGLSVETHPQLGGDVSIDADDVRSQMEKYMNGLQRYLTLMGVTAKSLAPQVVDPTPQIDSQINAICIQLDIPKRIFTGSERGELASSQDDSTWNGRLHSRQINYITPRIIVPFVDRLIAVGVLPQPGGYSVVWPDLDALTEDEQAAIAVKRTEALAKYVQGGVESLIVPMDYLTRVLGMETKEAEAVIKAAMDAVLREPKVLGDEGESDE